MTPEMVMDLAHQGMRMTLFIAAPMMLTALAVGLLVSLFQAATQINEMTLSFIPKILGVLAALVITGPALLRMFVDFARQLFTNLPLMLG